MTDIIAIANEKGGVAKTTTTASLGGALVEKGQEVLLIDLDAQANLTLALGITPSQVHRSVADLLLSANTPLSVSRETSLAGLDIIPANAEMTLAERFLPIRENYRHILKHSLNGIKMYDTILIDCPPSLGAVTQNALVAADLVIIPTQPEYFSAHALRNMLGLVQELRNQANPSLKYRILITMLDIRLSAHKAIHEQLKSTLGNSMFETVIQIDSKLRECTVEGLPITHFTPKSRGARQYRALAQEIHLNDSI
jgi:chromosome partitioning protein